VYLNQRLRRALAEYAAAISATAPPVCQSKGRALLSQHYVPAVLGYLQGGRAQGCQQSQWAAHVHHTAANKGVGVRLLAELAGHSHISTTQRYIDVNAEQFANAVELL
jgi:integrase/recombinase XerD